MKKIVKTIGLACLAGLFAVAASSCKKTEDNTTSVELTMEQIEDVYPGNERAYINVYANGATYWNANDRIRGYNLDVANDPNAYRNSTTAIFQANGTAEGQHHTTFYGGNLGTKLSDYYYFFYPVNMVNGVLGPYNIDTFTVAPVQSYTEKIYQGRHYATVDPTAMPLASKHTSLHSFTMNHVFGYFRIWLAGDGVVESAVLTDPNHNLTGYATMRLDKCDVSQINNMMTAFTEYRDTDVQQMLVDYIYNPNELCLQTYPEGNTIELIADNPLELDTRVATAFLFAVRPGALWWNPGDEPFSVTFNFSDGHAPVVFTGQDFLDAVGGTDTRMFVSRPGRCINVSKTIALD